MMPRSSSPWPWSSSSLPQRKRARIADTGNSSDTTASTPTSEGAAPNSNDDNNSSKSCNSLVFASCSSSSESFTALVAAQKCLAWAKDRRKAAEIANQNAQQSWQVLQTQLQKANQVREQAEKELQKAQQAEKDVQEFLQSVEKSNEVIDLGDCSDEDDDDDNNDDNGIDEDLETNHHSCNDQPLIRDFLGHTRSVEAVAPCGTEEFISGSDDGNIKIWNTSTGKCCSTSSVDNGAITSITPICCGSGTPKDFLLGCWLSKKILLWDSSTTRCIRTYEGHTGWVLSVDLVVTEEGLIKGFASGSADGTVKFWTLGVDKPFCTLKEHEDWVESVTSLNVHMEDSDTPASGGGVSNSKATSIVLSGSRDHTIKAFAWCNGECLRTFVGHTSAVLAVTALANRENHNHIPSQFLSASADRTIRLWEFHTGNCLQIFVGHTYFVESLTVLPPDEDDSAKLFVSGSTDKSLKVWDISSGECVKTLNGHSDSVRSIAALGKKKIVSCSRDKTIKLWSFP